MRRFVLFFIAEFLPFSGEEDLVLPAPPLPYSTPSLPLPPEEEWRLPCLCVVCRHTAGTESSGRHMHMAVKRMAQGK